MNDPAQGTGPLVGNDDWASPNHIRTAILLLATLLAVYVCYLITVPFLASVVWSISLAVLFAPFQEYLEKKLQRPSLAAWIALVAIASIVIVPTFFAIQQLAIQAAQGATFVEGIVQSGEWKKVFSSQPRLSEFVDRFEGRFDLQGVVKSLTEWLSGAAVSILKVSTYQLIDVGMTFYFLFYLLRDRRNAKITLCRLSPLKIADMNTMFTRVSETIFATVYGSFVVAFIQGVLLAFMFWLLSIPSPILWGLVMGFLALVPVAGAFLVWAPAAVYLALEGRFGAAILLVLWGLFVIVVIDNLLRPVLVGKRLQIHPVFIFVSVVGGIVVFGPSGILLGPMVFTITQVLLELNNPKSNMVLDGI